MTWQIGSTETSASTEFAASKRDLDHSPLTVTIDSFDPLRSHATVVFGDVCVVTALDELDEASGMCAVSIASPHAELLLLLPIHLATLLTSIEAAHREMLDQPPVGPATPGRDPDAVRDHMILKITEQIAAHRRSRLEVVPDEH